MKKFTYNRNAKRPKVKHALAVVREAAKRVRGLPEVVTPEDINRISDDDEIYLDLDVIEDTDGIATFYLDFPMRWRKDRSIVVKNYYFIARFHFSNGVIKRDYIIGVLNSFERGLVNKTKKYLDEFKRVSIWIG